MSQLNTGDLGYAIQCLIADWLAGNVHTAMPGKVESYNSATRTGQVKPLLKMASIDGTQTEIKSIPDVPFAIYGTAKSGVVLPIAVGDYVLLIFSERTIGQAMQTGAPSNTSLNQMYALGDAIALPGLFPSVSAVPSTGGADITIVNNGGKVVLNASGDIEIGNHSLVKSLCTEALITALTSTPDSNGGIYTAINFKGCTTTKAKAQ
jgi:hypothetical protein